MKKTIAVTAAALTLILALAGCAAPAQEATPAPTQEPTTAPTQEATSVPTQEPTTAPTQEAPGTQELPSADVYAALTDKYEFAATMEMDEARIQDTYGVDLSLCEDYLVMEPMMNVKTAETAIFRLKDAANAPAFEEACAKRAAAVAKTFESYLQDQYEIAKNPVIKTIGNYVVMIINEDAEAMMQTVEEALAQ